MNQVFFTEDRIVILSDSRKEATELASSLQSDGRTVHSLFPPFSNAALEILVEAILQSHEPTSDTDALLHVTSSLETLLEILSYVRESSSRGIPQD